MICECKLTCTYNKVKRTQFFNVTSYAKRALIRHSEAMNNNLVIAYGRDLLNNNKEYKIILLGKKIHQHLRKWINPDYLKMISRLTSWKRTL